MGQISIKGIRIDAVSLKFDEGSANVESHYSLLSSSDKVLAKQAIGGYSDLKVEPAADTVKLMNDFIKSYRRDVNNVLGLDTE